MLGFASEVFPQALVLEQLEKRLRHCSERFWKLCGVGYCCWIWGSSSWPWKVTVASTFGGHSTSLLVVHSMWKTTDAAACSIERMILLAIWVYCWFSEAPPSLLPPSSLFSIQLFPTVINNHKNLVLSMWMWPSMTECPIVTDLEGHFWVLFFLCVSNS